MTKTINIDNSWTLFLDRDGVINEKRENDYVKSWEEFVFINGSVAAITELSNLFGKIIVVTNQSCIRRGIVSEGELHLIHDKMVRHLYMNNGRIDKIYYCPEVSNEAHCRKPNSGMAFEAKLCYPEIDFKRSIIVGDSMSDMLFGRTLGMVTVFVNSDNLEYTFSEDIDYFFSSLLNFSQFLFESKSL